MDHRYSCRLLCMKLEKTVEHLHLMDYSSEFHQDSLSLTYAADSHHSLRGYYYTHFRQIHSLNNVLRLIV